VGFITGSRRGDALVIGTTGSLLIMASLMVWVQVPVARFRGVQADGSITAVLGILVVLIAIAALRDPTKVLKWSSLLAFSVSAYVPVAATINWSVGGMRLDHVGPGLPLAFLASVVGMGLAYRWVRVEPLAIEGELQTSIDSMNIVRRRPGWGLASVLGLGLVVIWQVFSAVVGNAPIGGYGDFSDTAYGDVDWDRVAVAVVECAFDQGFPVNVTFQGSGISYAEVPTDQNAAAVKIADRCEAGLNLPELDDSGG